MPRPNQTVEKRAELLPTVARTFAGLGYRRTTTAELAERCGVRENILYRLWPDKKAMFIDSINYVYEQSAATWRRILDESAANGDAAIRLLEHEAEHYGESGLQRIVFAGLSETDEPEIRDAMRRMYGRFHQFVKEQIAAHRNDIGGAALPDETISAWAIVGLGNLANVGRELGLLSDRARRKVFREAGRLLLNGMQK